MLIAACLIVAGNVAGNVAATIPGGFFTLRWTDSVEQVLREEDYRVAGDTLVLMNSRVRGSGAGLDPPPGATLKDGVWHRRENRTIEKLSLARSAYAPDYQWCNHSGCRTLAHWLGPAPQGQFVEVRAGTQCRR